MIDYENIDPDVLKEWDKEHRKICRREMTRYLKDFPDATPEEKRALNSWVRSGHSPYENGDFISAESGGPMDFINAIRFQEEMYQEYLKNPEDFFSVPDGSGRVSPQKDTNSDLPF